MQPPSNPAGGPPPNPWAYLGLGFEIAVPVVLCIAAGYWLDGRLGTEPWLLVLGGLLGMALGFYGLFKRVLGTGRDRDGSGR